MIGFDTIDLVLSLKTELEMSIKNPSNPIIPNPINTFQSTISGSQITQPVEFSTLGIELNLEFHHDLLWRPNKHTLHAMASEFGSQATTYWHYALLNSNVSLVAFVTFNKKGQTNLLGFRYYTWCDLLFLAPD